MDVGELPNAAGLVGRRAAVLGTAQSTGEFIIDADVNNSLTNTVTNRHTNSGWWIPSSGIVTSPTNTDVMNQLCRVCGEPAAGFHFGAFTCEGCKSFFGRTYNNLSSISECKNGGVCVINKKNRTSCKACRLRKCLMVGMSKSGSRYGRRSNWFKIHCLLQEQSHQAQQARLKDPNKSPFEKVLSSLDAANNNNNNNSGNSAAASGLSPGASQQRLQPRLLKPEDPGNQSRAPSIGPRSNMAHDLLRPDATFPIWRTPPFFHPAFSHMQFLNTSFLTFRQNFGVPYVHQDGPQIPITSISSSSSESLSPRSTPSEVQDDQQFDDKNVTFRIGSNRFGPEQDEPMDLSRKTSVDVSNDFGDNSDCVGGNEVILGGDNDVIESDTGPPLDLSWKT